MIINRKEGTQIQIGTTSRLWEPLCYPLFFPHGTLGWGLIDGANDFRTGQRRDQTLANDLDAPTTQIWHYRARLLREPRFEIFGRLTNEYLVDMWTREIDSRLAYIRRSQEHIRREDAELMGVDNLKGSENVFLPSSFLGSRQWCADQVADALAIAAFYGNPTFFITITANPQWPEIQAHLRLGQTFADIPVIVARAFHSRLTLIMNAISHMFPACGAPIYKIYVIEFQKRGLPHCHLLIKFADECVSPIDIDRVVTAEIPSNPADAALIRSLMYHSHRPETASILNACQRRTPSGDVICKYGYPHQLQNVTTIDVQGRPHYRRRNIGDEMVVPHCLGLICTFVCHINMEVANTSHLFQYLFKYIHKGPDRATYSIGAEEAIDEIKDFWTGRYISAGEAAWRILGFHITHKYPSVECLPVHLSNSRKHHQYFRVGGNQSKLSLLNRYFLRPIGEFLNYDDQSELFRNLTYLEYFRRFRLINSRSSAARDEHAYFEQDPPQNEVRSILYPL
jgi:Helitron helicase-like domain at N-terminus